MKISQRLKYINNMIHDQYEHIWDCCCDHGLLGAALLKRNAAKAIHFVDVVPELMHEIEQKLTRFYPVTGSTVQISSNQNVNQHNSVWQIHCADVGKIQLAPISESQLIIIAGVGGDLTISLVAEIIARHPNHTLEFIICPVHHTYKVRQAMQDLGMGLLSEHLLQENKRFYEIIHLIKSPQLPENTDVPNEPVSLVGSAMWDFSRDIDKAYLQSLLNHYQRIEQGLVNSNISQSLSNKGEITILKRIIKDYQALLNN
ncbi:tRNA (adenine(22)-N(1))-methyltransferase TrmK [Shewanella sp. 10N.261.52.F9]|uniref:tRNA (adenine(22)-N(1))-methyltransferase n=1 Tax=Shewanella sp. 10N.261.52.F9 TaxID=3229684 RepID=UPI00354E5658